MINGHKLIGLIGEREQRNIYEEAGEETENGCNVRVVVY